MKKLECLGIPCGLLSEPVPQGFWVVAPLQGQSARNCDRRTGDTILRKAQPLTPLTVSRVPERGAELGLHGAVTCARRQSKKSTTYVRMCAGVCKRERWVSMQTALCMQPGWVMWDLRRCRHMINTEVGGVLSYL